MARSPIRVAENIARTTGVNPLVAPGDAFDTPFEGTVQAACAPLEEGANSSHVRPDIRHDESNADYHSDETYRSCSRVKTFLDSPHLYHKRYISKVLPPYQSSALDHGTLMHRWLEEGDAFLETLVSPPQDTLTSTGQVGKDAKKWAENEAPAGATVVGPKERAQILAEVAAIRANPAASELIDQITDREVSIRWVTGDGHRLKCRADAITPDVWIDLKTTSDEDILSQWPASCIKFKYHLQDAWYRLGMEACGREPSPLRFIVISTSVSHDCEVVTLPDIVVAEGRRLMDRALADLKLREDLDWWLPDHHGEVIELKFPAYLLRSFS